VIGYRYTNRSYRPIQPDTQGRIFLEPVGLSIGITRDPRGYFDRLACYDPQTGQELGDYTAVVEALAEAEEPARAAEQQARAAQRRARTAAKRGEAEARVDEARAKAEGRIRDLEAKLKRST
jgi:hypothetical protein